MSRSSPIKRHSLVSNLFLLCLGYLLVMGPWFWHTWRLTGRPLTTVGAQTVFLTTYDDVFAYNRRFDLSGYLNWGLKNIIVSKLEAAWLAIQTFIAVTGLTAFTFFVLIAWIGLLRRRVNGRFLEPFTWYTIVLFTAMSLVFTFPGQRGSLLHSSTAIWPWSMALVPLGLGLTVDWIAARRPHWRARQAKRFFAVTFLVFIYLISVVVSANQPLRHEEAAAYRQIGEMLPAGTVVMTGDPPGFHYHTGLPAVVTPNEPPNVVLTAAHRYGASYLLLDADRPEPLAPLYEGKMQLPQLKLVREFGDAFQLYQLTGTPQVQ